MDMSLAADIKRQKRGASWISAAISSGSALPRWLRKFKLGGSSSSSLLPIVAPSQQQPAHWESHSPGTRGFAAGAPRPSSQRRSSAAAESTSNSVSEILQGGSFTPPPSLTSASSSPSRDTATRTPSPTTGENAAPDATGIEEPVGTRRSGSPREPPAPATPATAISVATTTDHEDKVLFVIIAASLTILGFIKDIHNSWKTEGKVPYGIFMMLSLVSTVTGIFTALSPADSRARTFSPFFARFGLLVAIALFVVNITCQLGPFGCVAGVPTAAVVVLFLAVVWWRCSANKPARRVEPAPEEGEGALP